MSHSEALPEYYRRIAEEDGLERAVTDYVSGMTDKYVIDVYMDLFIPAPGRCAYTYIY